MQNSIESYYPCVLKETNKTKKYFFMTREANKIKVDLEKATGKYIEEEGKKIRHKFVRIQDYLSEIKLKLFHTVFFIFQKEIVCPFSL